MFELLPFEVRDEEGSLFYLFIIDKENIVAGYVGVFQHPGDEKGAEVHLEIGEKWRKRWLSRTLREGILELLIEYSRKYNLETLYSTALTPVSPRLLEFFRFKEYYEEKPKTYYYMEVA